MGEPIKACVGAKRARWASLPEASEPSAWSRWRGRRMGAQHRGCGGCGTSRSRRRSGASWASNCRSTIRSQRFSNSSPPTQQKGTKSLDTSYGTFLILLPKILSGALVATLEKVKAWADTEISLIIYCEEKAAEPLQVCVWITESNGDFVFEKPHISTFFL